MSNVRPDPRYAWSPTITGSVGHVSINEINGSPITSQFPLPHGTKGINTTRNWSSTIRGEDGRNPNFIFKVNVPNDKAFDAEAERLRNLQTWHFIPDGEKKTNCSNAAYNALSSGGVKKGLNVFSQFWPLWMATSMLTSSIFTDDIVLLEEVPWKQK